MPGFWKRFGLAFRCFSAILSQGEIPRDIARDLGPPASQKTLVGQAGAEVKRKDETPAAESLDRAVQTLALLQRDGRLIDFLTEDVAPYPDAQLGAAVRTIHESCRQVLERYFKLEPVLGSEEDQAVTVPAGFDPALIKLIGNATGETPVKGLLRHRGWRVVQVNMPSLPEGSGRMVVAQAEVEVP